MAVSGQRDDAGLEDNQATKQREERRDLSRDNRWIHACPRRHEEEAQQETPERLDVRFYLRLVVGVGQQRASSERSKRVAHAQHGRDLPHAQSDEKTHRHKGVRAPGAGDHIEDAPKNERAAAQDERQRAQRRGCALREFGSA
eukprot:scaffold1954_cov268-Pinguiococcus_pyrenoidosus.AAC.270